MAERRSANSFVWVFHTTWYRRQEPPKYHWINFTVFHGVSFLYQFQRSLDIHKFQRNPTLYSMVPNVEHHHKFALGPKYHCLAKKAKIGWRFACSIQNLLSLSSMSSWWSPVAASRRKRLAARRLAFRCMVLTRATARPSLGRMKGVELLGSKLSIWLESCFSYIWGQ